MRRFGRFQGVTRHSDLLRQNYFALRQTKSRVSSSISGDLQKQYDSILNSINQQLSTGQLISLEHLHNLRQLISGVGMCFLLFRFYRSFKDYATLISYVDQIKKLEIISKIFSHSILNTSLEEDILQLILSLSMFCFLNISSANS